MGSHIEMTKQNNPKLGKLMENQKNNIDFSIAAILTLNTFAHTLGAAGVGAEAAKHFGEEYMFYISAILTILILVFSEIIPKTLGAYYWKSLSGVSSRMIKILVFITYPILIVMKRITTLITPEKKETITKEEILATVNVAEEKGVIREKETDMIENLLKLRDVKVEDILTPRSVLFSMSKEELLESFKNKDVIDLQKLKECSRVPIFGSSVDDILGIIISKELFHEYVVDELTNKEDIIKKVSRVNENVPISKLIDMFISKKEHMFIVTDNYGQTEGVVTLEDAVETLLGVEIVDELDSNVDMREVARAKMMKLRMQKQK